MVLRDLLPRSKWTYVLIAALIVVGIIITVYFYRTTMKNKLDPQYVENKEFVQEGDSNDVQIVFFTVDWCPHCKKSLPIWKEFTEKYHGKTIGGYTISCETYDCTNNNDNIVKRTMDKYNIEGFPTIKMIKNDEVYDYDAKPSMDHLEQWINVTLK